MFHMLKIYDGKILANKDCRKFGRKKFGGLKSMYNVPHFLVVIN